MRREEPVQLAQRTDAEGVRRDVDQDRPDVDAGDQAPLDGRPHGDGQVGLDLGVDRAARAVPRAAGGPAGCASPRRPGRPCRSGSPAAWRRRAPGPGRSAS